MVKMWQIWLFFDDFVPFCYIFVRFTSNLDPFPPYLQFDAQNLTKTHQNVHKSSKYGHKSSNYHTFVTFYRNLRPKCTPFPHICNLVVKSEHKIPIWVVYMRFWDEFGCFCVILWHFTSNLATFSPYLGWRCWFCAKNG